MQKHRFECKTNAFGFSILKTLIFQSKCHCVWCGHLHREAPGHGVRHPPQVGSLCHDRFMRHTSPHPDSAAAHNRVTAASEQALMHTLPQISTITKRVFLHLAMQKASCNFMYATDKNVIVLCGFRLCTQQIQMWRPAACNE